MRRALAKPKTLKRTQTGALVGMMLVAVGLATPVPTHADPARPCTAVRPCLTPQYCPSTGGFVVGYEPCPALVTGPYAPGGLQPNGRSN